MLSRRLSLACCCLLCVWGSSNRLAAQQTTLKSRQRPVQTVATSSPQHLSQTVIDAFESTHDGWSSDEVILNEELNAAFITACQTTLPDTSPTTFNQKLINLRKAGKLKAKTTSSNRKPVGDVIHVAEIAARSMHDRHAISTDQIMVDPQLRTEFNALAQSIAPGVDPYRVRKAAFQLRKTRKLKPELIARIADWGRTIDSFSVQQWQAAPERTPHHLGIYIFRDKTGYLYIGQTEDLNKRLKTHLTESHNQSLASYLKQSSTDAITIETHSFPPDSRLKETRIRRAYESELIASRKPRFNIQP